MHWGKEAWIVYFGADSTEVYVYIGREHKINSEYKKSLFTSISSQEYGSLYTWQKYQRSVWSHHRLFTLWNKSTWFRAFFFLNSCLLEFWWWNIAACSIPHALNFSAPPFGVRSFSSAHSLSSLAYFFFTDLTSCGYADICIWMCFWLAFNVWKRERREERSGNW